MYIKENGCTPLKLSNSVPFLTNLLHLKLQQKNREKENTTNDTKFTESRISKYGLPDCIIPNVNVLYISTISKARLIWFPKVCQMKWQYTHVLLTVF